MSCASTTVKTSIIIPTNNILNAISTICDNKKLEHTLQRISFESLFLFENERVYILKKLIFKNKILFEIPNLWEKTKQMKEILACNLVVQNAIKLEQNSEKSKLYAQNDAFTQK